MEFKKEHPLYFESSSRLLTILGRESISNPNIALIEMIKNAYDADAEEVNVTFEDIKMLRGGKIIIEDDGHGMTEREIKDYWMKPATDNKAHEPTTRKYKRKKIGEKGIARFALSTLSQELELTTKPLGSTRGYRIFIDWSKFEEEGGSFERIPIEFSSFSKKKVEHGTTMRLSYLRPKWDKSLLERFIREAELITPPTSRPEDFRIYIHVPDHPDIGDKLIANKFLRIAPYSFEAKLDKGGNMTYLIKALGAKKKYPAIKTTKYSCGPVEFKFWFLPRAKGFYNTLGNIQIEDVRKFLDEWGGIKLYRDNMRVKPYGDPGNDWLGLESSRINDPSVIPGNDQVFGYVMITKGNNSNLIDTSTREGLIYNTEFRDLQEFIKDAVSYFAHIRKALEGKREFKKRGKRTEKPSKTLEKIRKDIKPKTKEVFIDFSNKYPEIFYVKLESEINEAYQYNLPNAVLILTRKVIENLIYNLMEEKFSNDLVLRWDSRRKRALEFGRLMINLSDRTSLFDGEQERLLKKLIPLIGRFRREANIKTHQVMDYLDDREQLKGLRIPDIIEILLKLIKKNK
jgi:hypothetical protein